jgi:sialate O-acetylesterase
MAKVTPAPIFGDHMVLQRDKPVPVWGTADAGEEVTITFGNQSKTTTADQDGNWKVVLDPMEASSEGRELRYAPAEKYRLNAYRNVLVGEVWYATGQSNMGWGLDQCGQAVLEDDPLLRLSNGAGRWTVAEEGFDKFSAVAYYTGRRLRQELGVPVGMICSAAGGSLIDQWLPPEDIDELAKENPSIEAKYAAKRFREKRSRGDVPFLGGCFLTRTLPLVSFPIRGCLWYQGEFNENDGPLYEPKQNRLFAVWRRLWNDEDLPIYYVQLPTGLAGIGSAALEETVSKQVPGKSSPRAVFREVQAASLKLPNTHMAVTIDLGDIDDGNHPRNKRDVGRRLSALVLKYTYGRDELQAYGAMYKSHEIKEGKFIVQFDHVGKGLMVGRKPYKDGRSQPEPVEEVKDGTLRHFAICGEDRVWYWAEARIEGDTVVAWSDKVQEPVALRYAFFQWPTGANLYNRDGLPAAPFRTDDWERKQEGKPGPDQVVEWEDASLR